MAARVQGYARQRAALRAALGPIAEEPVAPELNLARMVEMRRRAMATWWRATAAMVLLCLGLPAAGRCMGRFGFRRRLA